MAANVKVCEHYLKGYCRFGSNCKFAHVENSSSYLRKGIDQGRNVCSFYLRGDCKYGSRCKFEHPGAPNGRGTFVSGGGTKSGRHQEDPFSEQDRITGMNPYKAFNNFNSRNVNNFGPNASQTGDKGQVRFQNPSLGGYVSHNQPRRQVRFNDSGPQVRLYSQQGTGYRDIDKRNGQTDPPIRRPLFASTGKWLNSEATGPPRTTANQPCTPREVMAVVKEDMRSWVEGNMWPLSSYSYSIKSPTLPGLKDYSPEELRWEAYRATAIDRLENYEREVRALRQEASQWRHRYLSLTLQDTKQLMDRLKFGSRDGSITLEPSGPVFRSPAIIDSNETFFKDRNPTTARGGGLSGAPLAPSQSDKPSIVNNTAPPTAPPTALTAEQGTLGVTTTDTNDVNSHKLSSEDLAAFKAKEFVLGKIPICPPPPELCV